MDWISVKDRVPENRREVLAWGVYRVFFVNRPPEFLGSTKFNPCCDGGTFDIENCGGGMVPRHVKVTHWAEIVGPKELACS